ncbi:hypothetical protein E1B28_012887 [Marasmius oreades]|uniref:Mitochondrial carrier n=1 Tax=Marasmius oreades TaxID=181124 RepID=A0A9P7RT16_9AGAR|nr:uncharacterized protein E1B28_012887 [Marasmius oreades]KAG7088942.1 hypothetical protein E1B28_012887 [Marasmius oreades]
MLLNWLLIPSSLLSVAISVPLAGALTRWRVHHSPKRIQLEDSEVQQEPSLSTPTVTGYFNTLGRVYRLEGWAGLYKGFSPTFFSFLIIMSALVAWLKIDTTPRLPWNFNNLPIPALIVFGVLSMVVGIPMQVLTTRAIVTPYRLPYTRPLVAMKLLLSATERRQPWKIYLLPGVFVSQFCLILVPVAIRPLVTILLRPMINTPLVGLAVVAYFFTAVVGTILQTPLQIAGARLAVQRIRGGDDVSEAEVAEAAGVRVYSSEEVISVRDDQYPYVGLVDCLKKIIAEEGWVTLLRAWWITFLSFYASTLV